MKQNEEIAIVMKMCVEKTKLNAHTHIATISHPTEAACYACELFLQPPNPAPPSAKCSPPSAKCSPKCRKIVRKTVRKNVRKMFRKIFRKKRGPCAQNLFRKILMHFYNQSDTLGPQTGSPNRVRMDPPRGTPAQLCAMVGANHLGQSFG